MESKGHIIYNEILRPRFEEIDPISLTHLHQVANISIFKYNEYVLPKNRLFQFDLEHQITPQQAPNIKMLIFYSRKDYEVVSGYRKVKIEECIKNSVKTQWEQQQIRPGEVASLHIRTTKKSLCSITAIDKATSSLLPSSKINKESVFAALKSYEIDEVAEPYQKGSFGHCKNYGMKFNSSPQLSTSSTLAAAQFFSGWNRFACLLNKRFHLPFPYFR